MSRPRERLVVIAGDAAGMSAAAQARRLRDATELEIVVLEQGADVLFSACGIPYRVGGQVAGRDALIARTPGGVLGAGRRRAHRHPGRVHRTGRRGGAHPGR